MAAELRAMLRDPARREAQLAGLARVRAQLGAPGAVAKGAEAILELANLSAERMVHA
ncbi:hypothetical protein D3C72_2078880 [compost metagenome]